MKPGLNETIAREPAILEHLFVAEIHPWYLSLDANPVRFMVKYRNPKGL
jgi:hypothetical protein